MNDQSHDDPESKPVPESGGTVPEVPAEQQASIPDEADSSAEPISPPPVLQDPSPGLSPSSWRPADYYAAPRSAPGFPRWVPISCGVAAILAIGFMLIVGAFLRAGGLSKLVAIAFGQVNSEARRMFEDDVDPGEREAFSKALLAVRDGIAEGTIELSSALPVLQEMQHATRDGRLSSREVDNLTVAFEKALAAAPPPGPVPDEPPIIDL